MAADDEKTTVEVGEEQKDETKPKKGSKKLILFSGIGVVCLIVGVVMALFVVGPMMFDSGEEGTAGGSGAVENADHNQKDAAKKTAHKPKKKKGKDSHGEGGSIVYAIKDIVVNPAGTGGSRFLSVSFGFELTSAEAAQEFEGREMIVRDALITILSSKTVPQLVDFKQKEIIRYQIKKRLEKLLDTDELEGVYYTDFVLQ